MVHRISSDDPSIHTIRATLAGTVTGVRIEVPGEERDRVPAGTVVRVVLDGHQRFACGRDAVDGDERVIPGVYDSPDVARDPGRGVDRLREWRADHDVNPGGSVLLDVIEPGFAYGLREPGETAYYDDVGAPKESLASIARTLEDE